jgi:hypothetical protein
MNRFIKLTSISININYINNILIKQNKYHIYLASNKFDGIVAVFTNSPNSDLTKIVICEKENPKDYKIVSDWLAK